MPSVNERLNDRWTALVENACRYIESAPACPDLAELAGRASLSTSHFHRLFKAVTGLTPKSYAQAHRSQKVRRALIENRRITDAYLEGGFQSSGRFYEQAQTILGMSPTTYRQGGKHSHIRFAVGRCALGDILVAATDKGICAIFLGDNPEVLIDELERSFPRAQLIGAQSEFEQWVAQVVGFVDRPTGEWKLPLDIQGTVFQQRVWQALRKIPVGTTLSYAELAERIGAPTAVRAVASACAANKLAVAIPCHRVVRQGGGISGYRWGIERKQQLLETERQLRSWEGE